MFPRLIHFGDFSLPTYGLLFSVAVIAGLRISSRNAERAGIDPAKVQRLGMIAVLSGIFGAKFLLIIHDWSFYSTEPGEMLHLRTMQAGGVFSGGLICALVAGVWYMRGVRMPILAMCDASAPGIALGHAIGRIGCFAAGCCWGKPTEALWGVTFNSPLAHEWTGTPLGIPLVPTQLLESGLECANFLLLTWLLGHRKFRGQAIAAYLLVYGFGRFWLEYLRDDPGRGSVLAGALTGTQLLSALLIIAGLLLWGLCPLRRFYLWRSAP